MAQQQKAFRVKALKMFKASIDGAAPIMVHPGDVVEVDRFMFGMLVGSLKAESTEEKLFINKNWEAPAKPLPSDPLSAIVRAMDTLTQAILGKGNKGAGLIAR